MRFDFHLTTDGWRISEVNSDVPGGFIEASAYPSIMAEHYAGIKPTGDPSDALARALAEGLAGHRGASVAMVHATAYTDDRQVMIHLSERIEAHGLAAHLVAPDQLTWNDGRASIATDWHRGPVDAVVRFFPGEWLVNLPRSSGWGHFLADCRTPMSNPATALLTQSKRLPLVWNELQASMPTWKRMLPETRDPREVNWQDDEAWVVKPALGRVGDGVGIRDAIESRQWKHIRRACGWFPWNWIAQRRFQSLAMDTPEGPRHPSLGVFAIDGRAAGIYARLAPRPLIDHRAQDVAACVNDSSCGAGAWPEPAVPAGQTPAAHGRAYAR
jgi:glutathionylspermidine synthase